MEWDVDWKKRERIRRDGVLKGVTIADINLEQSQQVVKTLTEEFGPNRVIFVKTDVTKRQDFEDAFKKTIEIFKNVDILVNNAGILNEEDWEHLIAVNFNATVQGCLLGMFDYLPKYKSGSEAVIVNMGSVAGITSLYSCPIYSATKHAVLGLSGGFGVPLHYDKFKVRFITICPGPTNTALVSAASNIKLLPDFETIFKSEFATWPVQKPETVAFGLLKAIEEGPNGSYWVINGDKVVQVHIPDVLTSHDIRLKI